MLRSLYFIFCLILIALPAHADSNNLKTCRELINLPLKGDGFQKACKEKIRFINSMMEHGSLCDRIEKARKDEKECEKVIDDYSLGSFSEHFKTNNILDSNVDKIDGPSSIMLQCFGSLDPDCLQLDLGVNLSEIQRIKNFVLEPKFVSKNFSLANQSFQTDNRCLCMKESIKAKAKKGGRDDFDSYVAELDKDLNNKIYEQAAKNVLNDIASEMEDYNYFHLEVADENNFSSCDISEYQKAVDKKCKDSRIDPALKEKRIADIFGTFGLYSDGGLQDKFLNMSWEVMNIPQESTSFGPSRRISRKAYDVVRRKSSNEPVYFFFQNFFQQVSMNKTLMSLINDELDQGKTPFQTFIKLQMEHNPELDKVYQSMIGADQTTPLMSEFKLALGSNDPKKFKNFWSKHIRDFISLQPSAKMVMEDKDLFNKFMSGTTDKNIVTFKEKNDSLFKAHLKNSCKSFVTKFSELVCIKEDNFKKLADKEEVNRVIKKSDFPQEMKEYLLCDEVSPEIKKTSPFHHLASGLNPFLQSDLQDRILNPDKQTNGAASFVKTILDPSKERAREFVTSTIASESRVKFNDQEASTLQMLKLPSEVLKGNPERSIASQKASISPDVPSKEAPSRFMKEHYDTPDFDSSHIQKSRETIGAQPAQVLPSPSTTAMSSSNAWREELKNFLSENEEESTVNKHISAARDEDLKELKRLKDQLSGDNQKLINSMYQIENQKLKKLQEEYEALEKEYQVKREEKSTVTKKAEKPSGEYHSPATSRVQSLAQVQQSAPHETGSSFNGASATASQGASLAGTSVRRGVAGAAKAQVRGVSEMGQRQEGAYLVLSGDVKTEELKDVSSELIKYINEKNPDIETLQKIRDSKLVYQYKLARNGVELEKEIVFDYSRLSPDAQKLLESKISAQRRSDRLEENYKNIRRTYSVSSLRLLLLSKMIK